MRTIIIVGMIIFQISAMADGIDSLIGTYKGTGKNGIASVEKILIKEGDLLSPAVYGFILNMEYSSSKGPSFNFEKEILDSNTQRNKLTLSTFSECDDPSCWSLSGVNVEVQTNDKGEPYIKLTYDASLMAPEEEVIHAEVQGIKYFLKD